MATSTRDTIQTRIALSGVEDILAQLKVLGVAGEHAIAQLQAADTPAGGVLSKVSGFVAAGRQQLVGFGEAVAPVAGAVEHLGQTLGNFRNELSATADRVFPHFKEIAALTFGAAAFELFNLSKEAANATRNIDNMAKSFGVSRHFLEGIDLAAAIKGVEPEKAQLGLARITDAIGKQREELIKLNAGAGAAKTGVNSLLDTFDGGGTIIRGATHALQDFSDPLKALRINVAGFADSEKGNEAIIFAVSKGFDDLTSATVRASIARTLFGRAWRTDLPLFLGLSDAIKNASAIMRQYGIESSTAEEDQSRAFNRSLQTMLFVFDRMKTIVGNILGQVYVPVFDAVTQLIGRNSAALKSFAADIVADTLPAIKDLVALMGGGSVGDVKTAWLRDVLRLFGTIGDAARLVGRVIVASFQGLELVLAPVARVINNLFGSSLTGETLAWGAAILYLGGGFKLLGAATLVAAAAFGVLKAAALLALANPLIAAGVAALLLGLAAIDTDAIRSGRTLETLKGTWQGLIDINEGLRSIISEWFDRNITQPAQTALEWIEKLIARLQFLANLTPAGIVNNLVKPLLLGGPAASAVLPVAPDAQAQAATQAMVAQFDAVVASFKTSASAATAAIASSGTAVVVDVAHKVDAAVEAAGTKAKFTLEQLRGFDAQLTGKIGEGAGAPAGVEMTREAFNASAAAIKGASEQLKGAVEQQTTVLHGAVTDSSAALGKSVENGVTVLRGGAAAMGGSIAGAVENGVTVLRGMGLNETVNAHIKAFTEAIALETKMIKDSTALMNGTLIIAMDQARNSGSVIQGQGVGGGTSQLFPTGMATGGPIWGPGGTDNVPIWATAGEFVHSLPAVRFWGLDFMHMINEMKFPLPRFALGGLIGGPRIEMAAGGPVPSGAERSAFTLAIGNRALPLSGRADVVGEVYREARREKLTLTGVFPGWKG